MYKKFFKIVPIFTLILLSNIALAHAQELDAAAKNAETLGIWTITPPLVSIVLAFITKNVVFSLFTGIFSGALILALQNNSLIPSFIEAFAKVIAYILGAMSDSWNAGIILQCLTIGGLIALITKMGGAKAVAEYLASKASGRRSTQIITWFLGILVFFDDYANSLIIGPIMRPVFDKFKISREKLAFIVDATAAPIAGVALISTWIGYELSLIRDAYAVLNQPINAYAIFIDTIPYRFYNILIMVFVFSSAFMLKDFASMHVAETRALITGKVVADGDTPMSSEDNDKIKPNPEAKISIYSAIIPIAVLIVSAFIGFYTNGSAAILAGDNKDLIATITNNPYALNSLQEAFGASDASIVLFQAALIACIVAFAIGLYQKCFTLNEAVNTWVTGVSGLCITGVILLLAWSLSSVIKEMGTASYLVSILSSNLPAYLLPSIIFILGSIISFSTGTAYGTMGIIMPLAIPLAFALNPDYGYMIANVGAVLTGAVFGDHCSPISDTTILSSMGAGSDHLAHVKTQLPYALTVAVISVVFGFLPIGLGLSIYITLPIATIAVISTIYFWGKKV